MQKTLNFLMKGLSAAQPQTVGVMTVIPLIQDEKYHNNTISAPVKLVVSNSSYGNISIGAENDRTLVPAGSAYITKQRAQDHGLAQAVVVGKVQKSFNKAACIQSSQGGTIAKEELTITYLPLDVRKEGFKLSDTEGYSKLWPALREFSDKVNKGKVIKTSLPVNAHLVDSFTLMKEELDGFVAQFEPIQDQVGAIVLINGKVVGVERTPSPEYWMQVWEPLIRFTYGSYSFQFAESPATSRRDFSTGKSKLTLARLRQELDLLTAQDSDEAKNTFRSFLSETKLTLNSPVTSYGLTSYGLKSEKLIGHLVEDDGEVVYFSLNVDDDWIISRKKLEFEAREDFSM